MHLVNRFENLKLAFVTIVVLISINFWSFKLLSTTLYNILEFAACLALTCIVVYKFSVFNKRLNFKVNVLLFIFLPLLGVVGAKLYHDQSVPLSLVAIRLILFWLLYFVLHIFNISTTRIIKLILFIGCAWCVLTVVQQFTYPDYYFYTRSENIYRAGVYRYMIIGLQYGLFVLFYFFYKYLTTKKTYALLFVILALLGLFYYGTRQVAVAAVAVLFIAAMLLEGVAKWKYLLLMAGCILILVGFYSFLFQDYVEMTSSQLENEDYIRILAADFYFNQYWPHWGAKLLGNGAPHHTSAYGEEMDFIQTVLLYWRADVGIIGVYNQFGVFFVLNILWVNIKGMFLKIKVTKDKYLKLFFFYFTFILLLSQSYANGTVIPFYCLIFYLIDKSFQEENKTFISYQKELQISELAK